MQTITCMTANFVAREVGYAMTEGWGQGDAASNAFFQPMATFSRRLGELLGSIRALGFEAIDLWTAHLNPAWATREHIAVARTLLREHGLKVVSLAGAFGQTIGEFEAACQLAVVLEVPLLGGVAPVLVRNRPAVLAALRTHGLRLGLENHQERTPGEVQVQIGEDADVLGTALDTGTYATYGYPPDEAIRHLAGSLFHVHFRDVPAPGVEDSCTLGMGCVPMPACVAALQAIGYAGPLCVEHNPPDHDPTEDIRISLDHLQGWLHEARRRSAAAAR